MTHNVLEVRSVSKCFRIKAPQAKDETLITQIIRSSAKALQSVWRDETDAEQEKTLHWALRDVNLVVTEGEIVSVIGHNGSGKSTLLKILSRITAPTKGQVSVRGRLASLLEVGTGFHPDLSGRDNVFLNAAILGMRREEILRRFDAIVDFSGVGAFIDTPVKHYSSGMKVRLGFAVAAHLDPDILIIDEVLAVGDAAFQQRCLSCIEDVGRSGRTVLYVSHHLPSVARLSRRTVLLDQGRVLFDGSTLAAIRQYEERVGGFNTRRQWDSPNSPGDDCVRLLAVEVTSNGLPVDGPVDVRHPVEIHLRYEVMRGGLPILPSLHLHDLGGTLVLSSLDTHPEWHAQPRSAGVYQTTVVFPGNLFNEGSFQAGIAISTMEPYRNHLYVHNAVGFSIFDSITGDSTRGQFRGEVNGYLRPQLTWNTSRAGG